MPVGGFVDECDHQAKKLKAAFACRLSSAKELLGIGNLNVRVFSNRERNGWGGSTRNTLDSKSILGGTG
jgi:hypothetical protein